MSEISVKTQGQKVLTTWRHLGNETVNLTNANTNATPTIKFCVSKTSTRYCTCRQLQCAVFLTLQLQWIVCIKAKQNRIPEQAAMLDGITKQKVNKSFMTLYFSYLLIVSCWLKKCWRCEVWLGETDWNREPNRSIIAKREHQCHANHQVLRFQNVDTVLYLLSTTMCCVLEFATAVDRVH
jgi:hypothetical protein